MSTIEASQDSLTGRQAENADTIPEPQYESPQEPERNEFDYRPVTPLAPVSLFFGICAAAGFLVWHALAIGAVGTILGIIAIWKIRASKGELGGTMLARLGLALSALCLVGGSAYQTTAYIMELPEGHQRVSFSWFARQKPTVEEGALKLHPEIEALDGQPIYIKGYMYPGRKTTGITDFVLVKDSGDCCFGGQPKLEDMILVNLQNDQKVDLRAQTTPIGIGGVLRLDDRVRISDGLKPVYTLEGFHIR